MEFIMYVEVKYMITIEVSGGKWNYFTISFLYNIIWLDSRQNMLKVYALHLKSTIKMVKQRVNLVSQQK
jgi:hypothetical protein